MKDLQRAEPYLNVVKEMQEILHKELNVDVQNTSERYNLWALQTGLARQTQQNPSKKRKTLQPAELRVATLKREDMEIPTHLVQMYEIQGRTLEEALVNAQERMKKRHLIVEEGQMAVRIKERVIEEIEEIVEGRVVEIPIAPELRAKIDTNCNRHSGSKGISNKDTNKKK